VGKVAEQCCLRAGGSESDSHTGSGLDDPCSNLHQPQPNGGELGGGQRVHDPAWIAMIGNLRRQSITDAQTSFGPRQQDDAAI
jgi:hypothetical protein